MLLLNKLSGFGAGGSSSFVPTDISGLQAWYRADLGITKDGSDNVSAWADQSGNGRNVSEATNFPLWVDALVNGQPAVRFDGTNDKLNVGSVVVAQPLHIFCVFKNVTITSGDRIVSLGTGATQPSLLQRTSPNVVVQANSLDSATVAAGTTNFNLVHAVFNAADSKIALNDGAQTDNNNNLSGSTAVIHLGNQNAASFGNVEIAEFFFYNVELSGTNLTDVKTYINTRYALW